MTAQERKAILMHSKLRALHFSDYIDLVIETNPCVADKDTAEELLKEAKRKYIDP